MNIYYKITKSISKEEIVKQYTLHLSRKQTDNKLRWDAKINDVLFELYIPKWRVPTPWPNGIRVMINEKRDMYKFPMVGDDLQKPIQIHLVLIEECTRTARYRPDLENAKEWETGEPYIPFELLTNPPPKKIFMEVEWDYSKGTWKSY
jgi:hypothetical protein